MIPVDRDFFDRDTCEVARDLLGKVLRHRLDGQWLAAQLINGFTLKIGIASALFGAVAYGVISALLINALGLADVDFTRAAVS